MLSSLVARVKPILNGIARPSLALSVAFVVAGAAISYLLISLPEAPAATSLTAIQGRGAAVEFPEKHDWLNTEKPIKLADLKGRIVLLDFWTLCCINCIHTLPDLAKLEARYPGVLVVIGVHSPKFENEKRTSSILKAIMRYDIRHPVINDADHKLWRAYGVNAWPTLVLIDPDGNYYGQVSGEGNLAVVDFHINKLLKEYKGKLKKDPIPFRLEKEKELTPIFFPGKVLADAASKRIFIADSTNNRIVITNLEGKKIAIAGSGHEGFKDGKFADAKFSDPQGMALDGEILYVADRKNHSIRALNLKTETVKVIAGTGEQSRFDRSKSGLGTDIALNSPWDLLIATTKVTRKLGNKKEVELDEKKMYIAMAGHHQIWTYDLATRNVGNFAGSGREDIIDGVRIQTAFAQMPSAFAQPSGLATDGKYLYVADSETSSVRSVPLAGVNGDVTTIVGEGLFEFGDKNGKGGEVRLQHALGIAYLNRKLYVADTYNSKIKVIDPVHRTCETFLGDPPGWLKEKMFNEPGGVSISGGKMYIADTNNHRIQIVDMETKAISTLRLEGVEPLRRDALVAGKDKK